MKSPPDMSVWQGRDDTDVEGPDALLMHQCVSPWEAQSHSGICFLGFQCDEGVRRNQGRVGSASGPTALRRAMANFAWPVELPRKLLYDAGDVPCLNGDLESAQKELAMWIAPLLQDDQRVVVLGGGHETAWGSFLGLTEAYPDATIGIINIDAHFDLRPGPIAHSGTPFRQIAEWHRSRNKRFRYACLGVAEHSNTASIYQSANELDVRFKFDFQIDDFIRWDAFEELERYFIREVDLVYLSVDLDVLPGWIMPAVSAPAARGVPPESIERLIDFVADSGKLVLADVVEFNPNYDRDGLAARTAARLVWGLAKRWKYTPMLKRS